MRFTWRRTTATNELWPFGSDTPLRTVLSSLSYMQTHTHRVWCRVKTTFSYKKEYLLCLSSSKTERSWEAIGKPFFWKILPLPIVQTWGPVLWKPTAAQGNHVPVSMGLIFEILSPELKSAFEKAWEFLEGKIHLQYLLEIVGKKIRCGPVT